MRDVLLIRKKVSQTSLVGPKN